MKIKIANFVFKWSFIISYVFFNMFFVLWLYDSLTLGEAVVFIPFFGINAIMMSLRWRLK